MEFNQATLYYCWASGSRLKLNGKQYRVGKMSYGDYFLEPYNPKYPLGKGEREPFEKGTLWLEKIEKDPYHYRISNPEEEIKKKGQHLGDSKNKGRHLSHLEDFKIGDKVKISEGSGLDSGKTAIVVSRSKIITDGRGIPKNVLGAYKPVDWKREIAIQFEDGTYKTMFKNRLTKQSESQETITVMDDISEMNDSELIKLIPAGSFRGRKDGEITEIRDGTYTKVIEWRGGRPYLKKGGHLK